MRKLLVLGLVGLAAQLVDGALGMAYGLTTTTLLLITGIAPAAASASVHLAEIGTTLSAAVAHWRFGNVDWPTVTRLAGPGALGAFTGATLLSALPTEAAAPWMAGLLAALGGYLLVRFARPLPPARPTPTTSTPPIRRRFLTPLGLIAGVVDATAGGGWGPVTTPTLLTTGRLAPHKVIGSVDTTEFLVAAAASSGFLIGLGTKGFLLPAVVALLIGGIIAAPIAAWLVRNLPAQLLGVTIGGVVLLTNTRTLLASFDLQRAARPLIYAAVVAGWLTAAGLAVRALRRARHTSPPPTTRATEQGPSPRPEADPRQNGDPLTTVQPRSAGDQISRNPRPSQRPGSAATPPPPAPPKSAATPPPTAM